MNRMTHSFSVWCLKFHRDIYSLLMLGITNCLQKRCIKNILTGCRRTRADSISMVGVSTKTKGDNAMHNKELKDLVGTKGFIRVEVTRWNPSGQVEIKPLCSNCDGKAAWVKPEDIINQACDEKIEVHETWNSLSKKPEENEKCIVLFKDGKISGALHICGAFKTDFTNFDEKLVAWRSINAREIVKAVLQMCPLRTSIYSDGI